MKKHLKLFLLTVIALMLVSSAFSLERPRPTVAQREIYSDPQVRDAVIFLKDRLPQLITTDKEKALEEYMTHVENLNKLEELDVLYLVGHFYSVSDNPQKAIPFFELLINDPRLGDNARQMLNLLLYYRAVNYLKGDNQAATVDYIEDILNLFPTGKYYPTYLYLWADIISESSRHQEVNDYLKNYNVNREWLQNSFRPRKEALVRRIQALSFDQLYQNPTNEEYLALESEINSIQTDLQTLYNEVKSMRGVIMLDALDKIAKEELALLEELKAQLKSYVEPPPLDWELLASPDYRGTGKGPYDRYREGAVLLQQLKGTAEYYGKVIEVLNRFFDKRYDLFVKDDPSVKGKGFSDMELTRLIDIERNISIYNDIISSIDELMADPAYPSHNIDLGPQRQEYVEKLADLQSRKSLYLGMRKHEDPVEEAIFNELLEEYYALHREKEMLEDLLPQVEEVMTAMVRERYPKTIQGDILAQRELAADKVSQGFLGGEDVGDFFANLDFIQLELDYRNLRYRDLQRQKVAATLSEQEMQDQYNQILADKAALLQRHQDFVSANPGFQALEQPGGGYLINNSILYYNMAELQYAVDLDRPELALAYYRKVLQTDPDFFLRDYALYNIAYLSSEVKREELDPKIAEYRKNNPNSSRPASLRYKESDFREAISAYQEVTTDTRYQNSSIRDESLYRLSVLYFLIGADADEPITYYEKANNGFNQLIADENSSYRYEALYQRGWVNMNRGDLESLKLAMADFTSLLEAVDSKKIENANLAQDFKNNAVENLAYTLIALDGVDYTAEAQGVEEIQLAMADYKDLKVKDRVMEKAALLKIGMQAPLQAIDYMELRLKSSPLELTNPTIVDSIIKLYHTPGLQLRPGQDLAEIRTAKYQFILDQYNNSSEWYAQNVSGKDYSDPTISQQLDIVRNAYEEIRIRHYNAVVRDPSLENLAAYNQHMEDFAAYRELTAQDHDQWVKEQDKANVALTMVMADKIDQPQYHIKAIDSLNRFNNKYPDNTDYFNFEGLSFKYSQRAYAILAENIGKPEYIPPRGTPATQEDLYTFFRDASVRFYNTLHKPDYRTDANLRNSAQVIMNLGEIELSLGHRAQAKTHYKQPLEFEETLEPATRRDIYLRLAGIAEDEKNYTEAESWYRKAYAFARNQQDAGDIDQQVKLQIQSSYESAEQSGDFALAADEYLRLAEEYKTDTAKYAGYRYQASEAYKKAGLYQPAIDLKLDLAKANPAVNEKYYLYYESWTIADSLMRDEEQGSRLKDEFIALYPASNLAFNLQVQQIDKLSKNPSQRETAAEMYLQLHDLVRAKKVDNGSVAPEQIYLWALDLYRTSKNQDKIIELLTYFTRTYPNHEQNAVFLTLLADEHLARGDNDKFEQYSRELFLKDKTQYDRYLTTANRNLGKIAMDFDAAHAEKDWNKAFAKRDEFLQLEARYAREGLPMDNSQAKAVFARADEEYKVEQAKNAYLKKFDQQLKAMEDGTFLNSTPGKLITVNQNTSWQRHLFGGKANRVPGLSAVVESQYRSILKLMNQPEAAYLDNQRRLHAFDLIGKINEHAAEAIKVQINRYLDIAVEMQPFKNRSQYSQAEYDNLVNNDLLPYAQTYIDQYNATALELYEQMYTNYTLAGYSDEYTTRAQEKLAAKGLIKEYRTENYLPNDGWSLTVNQSGSSPNIYKASIGQTRTVRGLQLGKLNVPAQKTLSAERQIKVKVAPDFAFLHLVYPHDPVLKVNGENVEYVHVAVDTLDGGNQNSIHYALRIDGTYWNTGENLVQFEFPNPMTESADLHWSLVTYLDEQKLIASLPVETMKIGSKENWTVFYIDPETGKTEETRAIAAEKFGLPLDMSERMINTIAKPIWCNESPESPRNELTFQTTFTLDTQFREGYLDFVAPNYATIYLNGTVLDENYPMDYDPDPFMAYPSRIELPARLIVQGKNTLQIVIQNSSQYRGMLAEINITKTGKE